MVFPSSQPRLGNLASRSRVHQSAAGLVQHVEHAVPAVIREPAQHLPPASPHTRTPRAGSGEVGADRPGFGARTQWVYCDCKLCFPVAGLWTPNCIVPEMPLYKSQTAGGYNGALHPSLPPSAALFSPSRCGGCCTFPLVRWSMYSFSVRSSRVFALRLHVWI